MTKRKEQLAKEIESALGSYSLRSLPGVKSKAARQVLACQIVESMRRVDYVKAVLARPISVLRLDPSSDLFDPLRAAMLAVKNGQIEEAYWFTFLFVHFGKNAKTGWRLARDVYGALGQRQPWTWNDTSANPTQFRVWLKQNEATLRGGDGIKRAFGNHRKFETLKDSSKRGTGRVVESYVAWVMAAGSHQQLFTNALAAANGNPRVAFDRLFESMNAVLAFGRTAKFDYLTMVAKLGLANLDAPRTYMSEATGPRRGAALLFSGTTGAKNSSRDLELWVADLEKALPLGLQPMQVLEDSLCNWQKSPNKFKPFRG